MNKKGIKLKYIFSVLILFVIVSTLVIDWLISMNSYKDTLSENHLDNNYNYVQKLKTTASHQLNYMKRNIESIAKNAEISPITQENLDNWYDANIRHFDMLLITDENGTIELISPKRVEINDQVVLEKGVKLEGELMEEALAEMETSISKPGHLIDEQLTTLITSPIYDRETETFVGMVAGVIFMKTDNVLKCIFANHQYENPTYVYVVDKQGRLIYHPDEERLEEDVSENKVVQQVLKEKDGSQVVVNSRGVEFFASYAYLDVAEWGVVVQTPTSIIDKPLKELFWHIVMLTVPVMFIILAFSSYIVSRITKPLNLLAKFSEKAMQEKNVAQNTDLLKIRSIIYEVRLLYSQVLEYITMLNKQATLDGLTKVANRRKFDAEIQRLFEQKTPFSLIMLDIDHFKKVNDTYGHTIGDKVLKFLASMMKSIVDKDDLVFRYGGEEFGILLKGKTEKEAYELAEQLRQKLAVTNSPIGQPIFISLGVSSRYEEDESVEQVIERADVALYQSKRTGRNKTTLYEPDVKINPINDE